MENLQNRKQDISWFCSRDLVLGFGFLTGDERSKEHSDKSPKISFIKQTPKGSPAGKHKFKLPESASVEPTQESGSGRFEEPAWRPQQAGEHTKGKRPKHPNTGTLPK